MKRKYDWKKIIADWLESGLSSGDYCRKLKIPPSSFYQYRKQFRAPTSATLQGTISPAAEDLENLVKKNASKGSLKNPLQLTNVIASPLFETPMVPTIRITTKSGSILEIFL